MPRLFCLTLVLALANYLPSQAQDPAPNKDVTPKSTEPSSDPKKPAPNEGQGDAALLKRTEFEHADIATMKKAATAGNPHAQNCFGHCYYHGTEVPKDLVEAAKWYRAAAQQGLISAQYYLGWCYEHGDGVGKDLAQALVWYRKAARYHRDAQRAVAELDPGKPIMGDNAFRSAKVGDWALYRMFSPDLAGKLEIETKITVIDKTPRAATYQKASQFIGKVPGFGPLGEPYTVDLTKPYSPLPSTTLLSKLDPKIETTLEFVANGEETITVAGKKYRCEWIRLKTTVGIGPFSVVHLEQFWISKDVPLHGLVRSESKRGTSITNVVELREFGSIGDRPARKEKDKDDPRSNKPGTANVDGPKVITGNPAAKTEAAPPADAPKNEKAEIARLKQVLLSNTWHYHDSLYPPGDVFRFNADGTWHKWKWNYWVVGPQAIRVHYDRKNRDQDTGVLFTFNPELTRFTGEFTEANGRQDIITGTRK